MALVAIAPMVVARPPHHGGRADIKIAFDRRRLAIDIG